MPGTQCLTRAMLVALVSAAPSHPAGAEPPGSFTGLSLPFGPDSRINTIGGVSQDGSVVVGGAYRVMGTAYVYGAVRWRRDVGFDEPGPAVQNTLGIATGVSADGCVVVGFDSTTGSSTGWVWTDSGVARFPGRVFSSVSADGTAAAGWSTGEQPGDGAERAGVLRVASGVWTPAEPAGVVGSWSRALSVSGDGLVLAGEAGPPLAPPRVATVRSGPRMIELPIRGGVLAASTVRVSASGMMVAGSTIDRIEDPIDGFVFDRLAWVWSGATGAVEIAGDFEVRGIGPGGEVVVGSRVDDEYGTPEEALIWDQARGVREVRSVLEQSGLASELVGWRLLTADAVSRSGSMWSVAGTGLDPARRPSGWVATFHMALGPGRAGDGASGDIGRSIEPGAAAHVSQQLLIAMARAGNPGGARDLAFDIGDRLFTTTLNASDGVGANIGDGTRFTRLPRPDLGGAGQWASHLPLRTSGPAGAACNSCHSRPADDGAGGAEFNVVSDPFRRGRPAEMIQRNTPHLFGAGAVQRLAEEMTAELRRTAEEASREAVRTGGPVVRELVAKGVRFGSIGVTRSAGGEPVLDTARVEGISSDLVVRPFHWKGRDASVREFSRDAAHREIGMQAVELVGEGRDADGDGVTDELSVGDVTSLTVYIAGQPRPTTRTELAALGLIDAVPTAQLKSIERGRERFESAGCGECHRPSMRLDDPVFVEPSASPFYRDRVFPGGQDPASLGLVAEWPLRFDLTRDQPDNRILDPGSHEIIRAGAFERDEGGGAVVELFGDLKRHDMGPGLAESVDETGVGRSVFLTENLWGVGSTAPYLHDGRATTLREAILAHGGEAQRARDAFAAMTEHDRHDLLEFLRNLVLFKKD